SMHSSSYTPPPASAPRPRWERCLVVPASLTRRTAISQALTRTGTMTQRPGPIRVNVTSSRLGLAGVAAVLRRTKRAHSALGALLRQARRSVICRTHPVYADAASGSYREHFNSTEGGCRAMNTTLSSASRRQPAYGERARSYERDTAAFQP